MKTLLALSLALLALIAFRFNSRSTGPAQAQPEPQPTLASRPISPAQTPSLLPSPAPQQSEPDPHRFFSRAIAAGGNPVYLARVQRHMALRDFRDSGMESTPEGKQIVALLANEGFGPAAAFDAYCAAADYWQMAQSVGEQHANVIVRKTSQKRMEVKYGLTNERFFEALFQVRAPVLTNYQRNLGLPAEGEPLLE